MERKQCFLPRGGLPGSNREIFGAKELRLTIQGVVSSLTKRPDTVGEPRRAVNSSSYTASLNSEKPRKSSTETSA
jgi:hypothetical protein